MKLIELQTPRLTLGEFHESDIPDILRTCNNPDTIKWLTTLPSPYTREEAKKFISETKRCWEENGKVKLHWAVRKKNNKGLVACVELRKDQVGDSIGLWVVPKHRGRGYAAEAVKAVASFGKQINYTKDQKIYYGCRVTNLASAMTAKKSGFVLQGIKQSDEFHVDRETGERFDYYFATFDPDNEEQSNSWTEVV